jgi:two-component system copper resistance phosphate regulon response regulator CusR
MKTMPKVLVVEDQTKLRQSLKRGLEQAGYEVSAAAGGTEAYRLAQSEHFDVVILDLMLPDRDGFTVLKELRREGFTRPVLILTARDGIDDRVQGLDLGADDYLVKPIAMPELLARLRARLRREPENRETILRAADLEIDLVTRNVSRRDATIELTRREFELLEYLVRNKNSIVTREMIARDVWKENWGATLTNVVDVYIKVLRRKTEVGDQPRLIHTVRGMGYALRDE